MTNSYAHSNMAIGSVQINAPVCVTKEEKETNREFLHSLKPCDFDSIQREKSAGRAPGTCEWIMKVPQFEEWNKKDSQVLWIFGKPGSGKSFLACYICEQLEIMNAERPVMWFFFDAKTRAKGPDPNSLGKFNQTCLHQLLMQKHVNSDPDLKTKCFKIAREKLRDGDPTPKSSLEAISGILEVLKVGYIVIDALDECSDKFSDELEVDLAKWLQELRAIRQLKIVITSRSLYTMQNMAKDTIQLHLSSVTEKSNRDIQLYIKHRLESYPIPLPSNSQRLVEKLQEKSDGMILYTRLMLDMCKAVSGNEDQLLENLDKSPPGLSKLYANWLKALLIDRSITELVRYAFQWLAVCKKPPRLADLWSVDAIRQQIEQSGSLDWTRTWGQKPPKFDESQFRGYLILHCLPLVEILTDDKGIETVRFVHTTVREFLEGRKIEFEEDRERCPEKFRIDVASSHMFAAMTCITYLRWDSVPSAHRPAYLKSESLQEYAVLEWEDHCERLQWDEEKHQKEKGVVLSFCKGPAFCNWLNIRAKLDNAFCIQFALKDSTVQPSPLHIVTHFGLWHIAELLLQNLQKKHICAADAAGNTPLHMAAARGSTEFVEKLILAGAPLIAANRNGLHPFHRAVRHGNYDVVETLVKKWPVEAKAANRVSPTPLHIACQMGREECAFLFLEHMPEEEQNNLETAIKLAVENGHYKIVRRLLVLNPDLIKNCGAPLLQAARKGEYRTVKALVKKGADLSYKDQHGHTTLHKACISGDKDLVKLLLRKKMLSDPIDNSLQTPLYFSAEKGFLGIVKCLIKRKANVNNLDNRNETPLFKPAANGHVKVVKALLQHGTDVTKLNLWGKSPLGFAAMKGHTDVVKLLLKQKGFDQNKPDAAGQTVLHNAAASLKPGQETIIDLLIDHGAQTDQLTVGTRQTALHISILRTGKPGQSEKQEKPAQSEQQEKPSQQEQQENPSQPEQLPTHALIKKLISCGVPLDELDSFGRSALFCATWASNVGAVKTLLEAGASMDDNSFFMAVHRQNMVLVKLFLSLECRPNLAKRNWNWNGFTALHMAVLKEHRDAVAILLQEGAPTEALDHNKMTPLMYAEHTGNEEIIQLLRVAAPEPKDLGRNALHWAAERCENPMNRVLGRDAIDQQDAVGRTPLHLAVFSGCLQNVAQLLDFEADTERADEIGQTPVHYASEREGSPAILESLLKSNANVEAADERGRRPLHLAAYHGCIAAVHKLLDAGAQLSGDAEGQTPLHLAVECGHEEVVGAILKKWGQEAIDCRDAKQRTVLHLAAQEGRKNLVSLLIKSMPRDFSSVVVDRQDNTGRTALHLAAARGHLGIVQLLLGAGALVHRVDKNRYMAMHLAAEAGHAAIVNELLDVLPSHVQRCLDAYQRSATGTSQEDNVGEAFLEALAQVKALVKGSGNSRVLDDRSDMWARDNRPILTERVASVLRMWDFRRYSFCSTLLMRAVRGGHEDVVKLVLQKVPEMLQTEQYEHANLLTLAASCGHAGIVRLLIKAGFRVNDTSDSQSTALHEAAKGGHVDVIKVLLQEGHADPDIALPSDGSVPLHLAAEYGHEEAVRALADAAFPNAIDDDDRTPLERACLNRHETIVKQLLEAGADVLPSDIDLATNANFSEDTRESMQEQAARRRLDRKQDANYEK